MQDKANIQLEKAALERELKGLRGQAGRLTKDLEKRDAVAEKKRESIMVNFNQTKGQLSSLEHALKSVQVDLEKTQFALEVKKGAL